MNVHFIQSSSMICRSFAYKHVERRTVDAHICLLITNQVSSHQQCELRAHSEQLAAERNSQQHELTFPFEHNIRSTCIHSLAKYSGDSVENCILL